MRIIGGRFEVTAPVSAGGMGLVYRALDRSTDRRVALKLLRSTTDDSELRFAREAEILASLSHPAIVRHVAHGVTEDGAPYLAMDWIEGETLYARLAREGMSVAQTVQLGIRLAEGLGHAHARGVVHRDLKPGNVILGDDRLEHATIVDFGVARPVTLATTMTSTGALIGTPSYMSPEQARGDRQLDARTDVFALGCVLYECVTGRMAFEGKHVLALLAKVVMWQPPRARELAPHVPAALDALLDEMIAKDPTGRPAGGDVVAARLAQLAIDDVAPGPRRTDGPEPATITTPRPVERQITSVIVAATPAGTDGSGDLLLADQLEERRARLRGALAVAQATLEVLRDGTIIAVVAGAPARAVVERSIACARAIRAAFSHLLVAVSTGELAGGEFISKSAETLLEPTVKALAREAMAVAFANLSDHARPVGAIRLDETTARLLPADTIVRAAGVAYLPGP